MTTRRIKFFKDYLIERFGYPLYRIPLDLGMGCPHKNDEKQGCIFCAENGSRAIHLRRKLDIASQIEKGISFVRERYSARSDAYIAYLQTYSNTFASVDELRKIYDRILAGADFKMLMISTRPDCLDDDVVSYLAELNQKIETWVEIGVQSSKNNTLSLINRQHDFNCVIEASKKLNSATIKSSAHIIVGLPEETMEDYLKTVRDVCSLSFSGLKIHNLLVLKNSYLGKIYQNSHKKADSDSLFIPGVGSIPRINEYEYIDILINMLRLIPENKIIMRLTADAEPQETLFPKWNIPKAKIIEILLNIMDERNLAQGDSAGRDLDLKSDSYLKIKTQDESFTFYNPRFKENYHSSSGGLSEALYKFIKPSNLDNRLADANGELTLLDVGFGLGYNAFTALNHINAAGGSVRITALELNDSSLNLAGMLFSPERREAEIIESLKNRGSWSDSKNSLELILGDARASIKSIISLKTKFDLIYLDAFSTQKNPELWSFDFIKKLSSLLLPGGAIITYSASFAVRGAFVRCGMFVGTTEPFGRKNGGTIASLDKDVIKSPLSEKDMNIILKSTAGTPFRDTALNSLNREILKRHERIIRRLRSKGIPKWFNNLRF